MKQLTSCPQLHSRSTVPSLILLLEASVKVDLVKNLSRRVAIVSTVTVACLEDFSQIQMMTIATTMMKNSRNIEQKCAIKEKNAKIVSYAGMHITNLN